MIAASVKSYLEGHHIPYTTLSHVYTSTSLETAEATHLSGEHIAKAVLLQDGSDYLLAVLPATHRIDLRQLRRSYNELLELANEDELGRLFSDCDPGAVPPLGEAYGVKVLVEDSLFDADELYFEAGDHQNLVHVTGMGFHGLQPHAEHGSFSRHI